MLTQSSLHIYALCVCVRARSCACALSALHALSVLPALCVLEMSMSICRDFIDALWEMPIPTGDDRDRCVASIYSGCIEKGKPNWLNNLPQRFLATFGGGVLWSSHHHEICLYAQRSVLQRLPVSGSAAASIGQLQGMALIEVGQELMSNTPSFAVSCMVHTIPQQL